MITRIDHGLVWTSGELEELSILIKDGKVTALLSPVEEVPADQVIDAGGLWVLPGGVDMHVHISDGAETFAPGSMCAAAGGITTVMDMAPFHACVTPAQFRQKVKEAEAACVVDFGLVAGIVVVEDDLRYLGELAEMGASYFKVFMPGEPAVTPQVLWAAVQTAAATGLRLGLHAEEIACISPQVDWSDPLGFPHSRPYAAESSAAAQVLEMARAAGAPVHICHVSARQTAEVIDNAKSHGVDVTAEIPAHFLLWDETEFGRQGVRVMTTPPLRTFEDNLDLWYALDEGVIDVVACDHYLGSLEPGSKDFRKMVSAEAGIAGLELSLPLIYSTGVVEDRISLRRFIEVTSQNPARICGLSDRKGQIAVGRDADLVLFDPEAQWTVAPQGEFSRNAGSPYLGWQLSGRVKQTIVRGRSVWQDEEIKVQAGWGKYQPSHHTKL
jgi:allantoinase